jgi:hypothetical protein
MAVGSSDIYVWDEVQVRDFISLVSCNLQDWCHCKSYDPRSHSSMKGTSTSDGVIDSPSPHKALDAGAGANGEDDQPS